MSKDDLLGVLERYEELLDEHNVVCFERVLYNLIEMFYSEGFIKP